MAELFHILKITVDEDTLRAVVEVAPGMPIMTSEDIEATARVYYLAPAIAKHTCLGDEGREFQDCMGDTWVAHLLEHLTVEIMYETGLAGEISSGRTRANRENPHLYEIELACPDDALVIGSLSSAMFMMDWAFLHGDAQAPDFPGTVEALRSLVLSLRGDGGEVLSGEAGADTEGDAEDELGEPEVVRNLIDVEGAVAEASGDEGDAVFGGAAADRGM